MHPGGEEIPVRTLGQAVSSAKGRPKITFGHAKGRSQGFDDMIRSGFIALGDRNLDAGCHREKERFITFPFGTGSCALQETSLLQDPDMMVK